MDLADAINLGLKFLTLMGLVSGLAFLGLQFLIKELERRKP